MRWQYAEVISYYGRAGIKVRLEGGDEDITDEKVSLISVLNRLGAQGWEAYAFSDSNAGANRDTVMLKRSNDQ